MSDQKEKATFVGNTKSHANVAFATEGRSQAVEIALELIKSSCAGAGHYSLDIAIAKLSGNADTIQEALKTRD
ncbi:hypothetical protein [Candidatus Spongiihabitans sp.]|uniref:hypothetical protein n=1 Tax=Candidatus Spongiihabitans sp. TaxID=3101308 RepID=UPI003C6EE5E6